MTNEEAIKQLKITKECDVDTVAQIKALDVAINALSNRPTGEPLTLDQLRYMLENDGEIIGAAVIVSEDGVLSHAVLDARVDDGICASTGASGEWLKEKDYCKDWIAYACQTAHIDREAWEPCEECGNKNCDNCQYSEYLSYMEPCKSCENAGEWKPAQNFCGECGRPLTTEAWSRLEKRLRG